MDLFKSVGSFIQSFTGLVSTPAFVSQAVKQDIGKPPVYPTPNTMAFINAYNTNATIYTIINYISKKFGNIPRYTYSIEDEQSEKSLKWTMRSNVVHLKMIKKLLTKAYGETTIKPDITPEGRLARLTDRPNDRQGQSSYYSDVCLFYTLTGEAFIELNRGNITDENGQLLDDDIIMKMPVLEKIVRPSQWVNPVPSKDNIDEVLYYRFEKYPGQFVNIPKVNMIHWKDTNPNYDGAQGTHLRGQSALLAGLKLLTQDNSATDASVAMQQNQGAKGILYSEAQANPTPVQSSQIQGVIDDKVNSTSRKGAVGFLGGSKYGYLDMGQTSIDMQLIAAQQQVFVRLCNLFGIPPAIFLTETTYENLQEAGKSLLTNKVLPACCSFRDEENRVLLPSFGLDPAVYTTDIDATVITELSEDMTALSQQLAISVWKSMNEKREAMGDERMDDPNMDLILVPNNLVSLDDLVINDGLNSFTSNSGNSNSDNTGGAKPGLYEQDSSEEGTTGAPGNAPGK